MAKFSVTEITLKETVSFVIYSLNPCSFLEKADLFSPRGLIHYILFTITPPRQIVQKPTQEKKQMLTPHSKVVADQVAKLVHAAEALKGELSFAVFSGVTEFYRKS